MSTTVATNKYLSEIPRRASSSCARASAISRLAAPVTAKTNHIQQKTFIGIESSLGIQSITSNG
jgi:hypothetical protein